jgi:hypothetical protein
MELHPYLTVVRVWGLGFRVQGLGFHALGASSISDCGKGLGFKL